MSQVSISQACISRLQMITLIMPLSPKVSSQSNLKREAVRIRLDFAHLRFAIASGGQIELV